MKGDAVIFPCLPIPDIPRAPVDVTIPPVFSPQAPLTGLNPLDGMIC